jgi:hypothetical protein
MPLELYIEGDLIAVEPKGAAAILRSPPAMQLVSTPDPGRALGLSVTSSLMVSYMLELRHAERRC